MVDKALIARLLLGACVIFTSWRAATVASNNAAELSGPTNSDGSTNGAFFMTWLPCWGIVLFIPELIVALVVNKGHEYKWWWPSVAIFSICNIPNVWVIELDIQRRISNASFVDWDMETLSKLGSLSLQIYFTPTSWARLVEQISFLALIVAKWLSPRGRMTHGELSQLLMSFIGIASDILDLMDNLHDELVKYSKIVVYVVLVAYTISHLQFTVNYTATRTSRLPWPVETSDFFEKARGKVTYVCCCCFETELWALIATLMSMDALFFILRLYLFFGLRIVTFGNLFFATKNGVIVAVDIYRMIAISCCSNQTKPITYGDGEISSDTEVLDMHISAKYNGDVKAVASVLQTKAPDQSDKVWKVKTWEMLGSGNASKASSQDKGGSRFLLELFIENQSAPGHIIKDIYFSEIPISGVTETIGCKLVDQAIYIQVDDNAKKPLKPFPANKVQPVPFEQYNHECAYTPF